jgi:hypothetical protein
MAERPSSRVGYSAVALHVNGTTSPIDIINSPYLAAFKNKLYSHQ